MIKVQADAADAPNSQQKPQHQINKSQINKKSNFKYSFQENPNKKGQEKCNTDTKEVKCTIQESTGGKEVRWRMDLERACSTEF